MQVSPANDPVTKKSAKINRGVLNTILLVLIIVSLSVGGGYFAGFQMGKKEGAKLVTRKVTDLLNPLNAVSDNPLFPHTIIGNVVDVSKTSVKVKMANGQEKQIPLTDKTKVTQQNKIMSLDDIKKDNQITIFTTGKDKDEVANRVVLK